MPPRIVKYHFEVKISATTSSKMSVQSDSTTDICKAASRPGYSFRLTGDNLNESTDATDTKAMRSGMRSGFGGFALCTKSKIKKKQAI